MNQVEEFLGQSQVEHPEEHPDEQSKPNEAKKKKLDRGRDRLMILQECRDQYDECVSAPVGLGQQNSTDFGINPPNVILESTHRHCSKNRRRCIDRVREWEQKRPHSQHDDIRSRTGIAPVDGGVHATSFALGSAVTLTLVAVTYVVRRHRGTKMTDSRGAYGSATV